MNSKFPDEAIRKILANRPGIVAESCPDENGIAAYLEGNLGIEEKARFEDHTSRCLNCQEITGLALKISLPEELQTAEAYAARPAHKTVLFRLSFPLAGVAAGLFLLVAAVVIFRSAYRESAPASSLQTAEVRSAPPLVEEIEQKRQSVRVLDEKAEADRRADFAKDEKAAAAPQETGGQTAERAVAEIAKNAKPVRVETAASELPAKAPADVPAVRPAGEQQQAIAEFRMEPEKLEQRSAQVQARGGAVGGVLAPSPDKTIQRADQQPAPLPGRAEVSGLRLAMREASDKQKSQEDVDAIAAVRNIIRSLAAGADRVELQAPAEKAGARTFHIKGQYWIDEECVRHPDAEIVRMLAGAPEFEDIAAKLPEILKLQQGERMILLFWNGKICLIR